jgi:L-aspartate oxidase
MHSDVLKFDFLVIGTGVAGLRAALELARCGRVLVATKDQPAESNSAYAQGGVAVALAEDDDTELHFEDTVKAGAGIVSAEAARVLVEEGPKRVRELVAWGARFDRDAGRVQFTREAAHSRNRVLHALGDATGWEIVRALLEKVHATEAITVRAFACATDLILDEGRVRGCRFLVSDDGAREAVVTARATLLATGGAGQVFAETTNPAVTTGDGLAMALRAGATLADLEFVQFHPTALALDETPRFLVSEAVRGEGAYLRNALGERFTEELGPRDQVARAIYREVRAGRGPVGLDVKHLSAERVRTRFPRIVATCERHGLDLTRDGIPVTPAAHYLMGGVATDLEGRTSLPGLYAAGETAATGVHGANRLASNSLLEGLVYGVRAAQAMESDDYPSSGVARLPRATGGEPSDCQATVESLRRRAWEAVGLVRDANEMQAFRRWLGPLREARPAPGSRAQVEAANLLDVAWAMASCAVFREESRGAHFRRDFADRHDERFLGHTLLSEGAIRLSPVATALIAGRR